MSQTTHLEKARAAWGTAPDWIVELAMLADRDGLRGAAARIGYSYSAISNVLAAKYRGDLGRIEQLVRGALMGVEVDCPVLGTIGRDHCIDEQTQSFRASSAHRAQLYHACRNGCPNARTKGGAENV